MLQKCAVSMDAVCASSILKLAHSQFPSSGEIWISLFHSQS